MCKLLHMRRIRILETTGPIEVKFYMEYLCLVGIKVYIIGPGHMIKMAAVPIYNKQEAHGPQRSPELTAVS